MLTCLSCQFWDFFGEKQKEKWNLIWDKDNFSHNGYCRWCQEKGSEMTRCLTPPSNLYYFCSFALSWLCQCPLKPWGACWVNAQWREGVTTSITWARGTFPNITQHLQQILHLLCITPAGSEDFINSDGSKFFDKLIWRPFLGATVWCFSFPNTPSCVL